MYEQKLFNTTINSAADVVIITKMSIEKQKK